MNIEVLGIVLIICKFGIMWVRSCGGIGVLDFL